MNFDPDIVALDREAQDALADAREWDALNALTAALIRADATGPPRLIATLLRRLGRVLDTMGNVQDTVIAFECALRALDGDPSLNLERELSSLGTVGKAYNVAAERAPLPDLHTPAAADELDEAVADPALAPRLLVEIGNAYLRQPQEGPALNAYRQALARPEIADATLLRAHALTSIAAIQRRQGDLDAAEASLAEGLDLFGEAPERRRALLVRAGIHRVRGEADRARETYRQALDLYAGANDPLGEGRALAGLGLVLLGEGNVREAQASYEQAVALAESARDDDTLWHALWGLARCQRHDGDLEAAARSLARSLNHVDLRREGLRTDEGKVTFVESVSDLFDELIDIHLARAGAQAGEATVLPPSEALDAALAVAERARGSALLDLLGQRRRARLAQDHTARGSRFLPFDERAPGMFVDFSPMSQSAPHIGMGIAAPGEPTAPDLGALLDEVKRLAREDGTFPEGDLEAMAARLAHGEATMPGTSDEAPPEPLPLPRLVFHLLPEQTAVFAVSADGKVHAIVVPQGRDAVQAEVARLRAALGVDTAPRGMRLARETRSRAATTRADSEPMLRDLYATYLAPLEPYLPSDAHTPLVIEPHGTLWLLPFAALLDADGIPLGERHPLLHSPSAAVLDGIRREPDYGSPSDLRALVVGNPAMPALSERGGLTLDPLPGAEREARAVAALFPAERCTLLTGEAAGRRTVSDLMRVHGIVHLATHGLADGERPLDSFVALADEGGASGALTAREVANLWLPADLVVLSACQTGLGTLSGDGVIGLARAFLVAGARAVVVSQWSVDDRATAQLMEAFYRGYTVTDDKAQALREAMRLLRQKESYASPRYWAGFMVVGAEA